MKRVVYVQYTNPAAYPPLEHSSRILADAGWQVLFTPSAEFAHVYGAAHGGRLFRENVRGHLRFLAKHQGSRAAERARLVMLAGCLLRAPRDRDCLDVARWLARRRVPELLTRT